MIRRPPRSTQSRSSAASDVYKRQCMEGYKVASGDLLLFTDADTTHKKSVISFAVSHLLSLELDALTVIPKMLSLDGITKITLPMISTFLHTRFSALRVNDKAKNTGYFFGSFFIMKKTTYDSVGTQEGVKSEIVEDGALGKKVKESNFKMQESLWQVFLEFYFYCLCHSQFLPTLQLFLIQIRL